MSSNKEQAQEFCGDDDSGETSSSADRIPFERYAAEAEAAPGLRLLTDPSNYKDAFHPSSVQQPRRRNKGEYNFVQLVAALSAVAVVVAFLLARPSSSTLRARIKSS